MDDKNYNGWHNYATWRVNLEFCQDLLNSIQEDVPRYRDPFDSIESLADYLKDEVENFISGENTGEETNIYIAGWAQAFVDDVDWYEIAAHWEEELVAKEDDDDEEEEDSHDNDSDI